MFQRLSAVNSLPWPVIGIGQIKCCVQDVSGLLGAAPPSDWMTAASYFMSRYKRTIDRRHPLCCSAAERFVWNSRGSYVSDAEVYARAHGPPPSLEISTRFSPAADICLVQRLFIGTMHAAVNSLTPPGCQFARVKSLNLHEARVQIAFGAGPPVRPEETGSLRVRERSSHKSIGISLCDVTFEPRLVWRSAGMFASLSAFSLSPCGDSPTERGFWGFLFYFLPLWTTRHLVKWRQHSHMQEARGCELARSGSALALEGYT